MAFRTLSGQSFTLGSSISSTQTTILLTSFTVPVSGTSITMATMGSAIAYGTLAPGTSSAELISFTGVTQNSDGTATLTGVTRGLNKEYPYTESSSFKQPHAGQTIFILSDAPQVFNEYPAKRNDETITGQFTFPTSGTASAARVGATYAAPTQDTEIASKKYVDQTALFGAPFATTTTPGIIALGTTSDIENGIAFGASSAWIGLTAQQYGARKIIGYAKTAGSANGYTMQATTAVSGYATGQIIGFEASFTNTGNATINVNGLGAKNLFLGSTGLFSGVISTGAYIGATYDGTQFKISESSSLFSTAASSNTVGLRDNNGDMIVPTTPINSNAATSKTYVDSSNFVTSSATTVNTTNTTANVATIAIVGGTLSTNKGVRMRFITRQQIVATNSGVTYTLSYGGTTIATWADAGSSGTPTFTTLQTNDIVLQGAGTTSTQISLNMMSKTLESGSGGTSVTLAGSTSNTSSIDSTVDKNLLLSCTAAAGSTGSLIGYFIEKI